MAVRGEGEPDAAGDRTLLGAVVPELPVALEPGTAKRVIEHLGAAAEARPLAQRVVVARLGGGERRERPLASLGDDIHDAADGIRAVQG